MKVVSIISMFLFLVTLATAAWRLNGQAYRKGYLDGYHHRQVENLPSIGIDNSKSPAPGLLGKG